MALTPDVRSKGLYVYRHSSAAWISETIHQRQRHSGELLDEVELAINGGRTGLLGGI